MNSNNGVQKKIFIDADEEITTVVDHLRHTHAQQVVFVIPQHALLLQSIVNLKLLAQEAQRMRKRIMIMTNDEEGIVFAQKAGILTQMYAPDGTYVAHINDAAQDRTLSSDMPIQKKADLSREEQQPRTPTRSIAAVGSQSFRAHQESGTNYAQQNVSYRPSMQGISVGDQEQNRAIHPTQSVMTNGRQRRASIHANSKQQMTYPDNDNNTFAQYEKDLADMYVTAAHADHSLDTQRIISSSHTRQPQIKRSFDKDKRSQSGGSNANQSHHSSISKKINLFVKTLIAIGIVSFVCVGLIVLLPYARIGVVPRQVDIDQRINITAQSDYDNYDIDRRIVPARIIDRDVTFTKTFSATGTGDVDMQKAQGTITIINEFDQNPQPLVATTRFIAENGVLFRLAAAATVPGMKDGEPGRVDALVVADAAGEDGNINPTRFTIPGFDASAKRDKIYAMSETAMTGGGAGGNGVKIVTEEDIARAQKEMEGELSQYVTEQVTAILRPDSEILLTEAMRAETIRSQASVNPETMAEDFMYEIVTRVTAVVFAQEDVKAIMNDAIKTDVPNLSDDMTVVMTYANIQPDIDGGSIKMVVGGNAAFAADVDVAQFSRDIVGVHHDDILSIIERSYNDTIDKVVIESVTPGFPAMVANRISRVPFMTEVIVSD